MRPVQSDILLVHPGGLGDVCLSESTFLSLSRHFAGGIVAVGKKSALDQFDEYFASVESLDGRSWAYLFSDSPQSRRWETIVLIGKDRQGLFRHRLRQLTADLVFIEMYPDGEGIHVEEYQLRQLRGWGIEPLRKERPATAGDRVIVYPERSSRKEKWPEECFVELSRALRQEGVKTVLMGSREIAMPAADVQCPERLDDVAAFFSAGGFFVSNDSGMAHFAAACGLRTLTIFRDADPLIWRPKNGEVLDCRDKSPTVARVARFVVSAVRSS